MAVQGQIIDSSADRTVNNSCNLPFQIFQRVIHCKDFINMIGGNKSILSLVTEKAS